MHEQYIYRCLQLAKLAKGYVAPNPMVGAVLVYEDKIIGEGYHKQFGGPHAEVECINSVIEDDLDLIETSVLYVSLEPCAHFGKTPPCTDLILKNKIKKVVVGCRDPFFEVDGKGIEKLKTNGVEVIVGVLEKECKELNKNFFTFYTKHRPYITLKWAQTSNGKIAGEDYKRIFISNEFSNRLVHYWRSESMAILVGTNTALNDDPELTVRNWPGKSPVRLVIDMNLRLPPLLKLLSDGGSTIVFNLYKHTLPLDKLSYKDLKTSGLQYYQVTEDVSLIQQVCNALYQLGIQSVFVEGGAFLLQSFIDEKLWDEAYVITNENLVIKNGLPAPVLHHHSILKTQNIATDLLRIFTPNF